MLQGHVKPRPVRIAFLLSDGKHSELALDGIFADSYKRWGGRFSLIVPLQQGSISNRYWAWLEAYDPDIIYSYDALSEELVRAIYERLGPSELKFHQQRDKPRLDVHGFKPDYRFEPLQSLATLFHLSRFARGQDGAGLNIIDMWHTERASSFLTDNFGTFHDSYGTGMWPNDALVAGRPLTIVDPEKFKDRRFGVPQDLNTLPSEIAAFEAFAYNRAISLSTCSIRFATKLNVRSPRWSGSFNLVVGNSFEDRILFWNARLLLPDWLDTDINCLRVEVDQLDDEDFLKILSEFLKRHNHVNAGSGGQSQLRVRSVSLAESELAAAAQKVRDLKTWGIVQHEKVETLDQFVPGKSELEHAWVGHRYGTGLNTGPASERFSWNPPDLSPPNCIPHFLHDAPSRQRFTLGFWANDLELASDEVGPHLSVRNRWHFPRRWEMASVPDFDLDGDNRFEVFPQARSNRLGQLSFYSGVGTVFHRVSIPNAQQGIYGALTRRPYSFRDHLGNHQELDEREFQVLRSSNEAKYFEGVIGLFGGVSNAARFLLHPFIRQLFADFGGSETPALKKVEEAEARLSKRNGRSSSFDLKETKDRQFLANLIVRSARSLKSPISRVSLASLKETWADYLKEFWEREGKEKPEPKDDFDWDEYEALSLMSCIAALRKRRILFQGQHFVCTECHHKNWIGFDELELELNCDICKTSYEAPVDGEWFFRPNEFLIDSLRNRSVLSLIWLLERLSNRARDSFHYAGPTTFSKNYDDPPVSEVDLLVVLDGQTMLCEVKSSWGATRKQDIQNLVEQAKILRPHIAVLAVMEEGKNFEQELEAAKVELEGHEIALELITSHTTTNMDGPVLPSD